MDSKEQRDAAIRRLEARRAFSSHVVSYIVVNGFLVLIWAATGAGYFWPAWVLGVWGIGLVMHAWTAFVQRSISEDDIRREIRRRAPSAAEPS
jgi:ABC-type phosphate transport system auxiliary subunit